MHPVPAAIEAQQAAGARSSRLIVVSNRVLDPNANHAGGLAHAVSAALQRCGGTWIGWSGATSTSREVSEQSAGAAKLLTFDLTARDFKHYYADYANRVLWPLLHGRNDLMAYRSEALEGYLRVNERFADLVMREARDGDLVWIHDYHLIPLASMLRARGARFRIGFFLHVPVPAPRTLALLPNHSALLGLLGAFDLVGVQTEADARALRAYLLEDGQARLETDGALRLPGADRTVVRAFPIGIDPGVLGALADASERLDETRELRESLAGRAMILGVDRLDYSKGLPQRLRAFGKLLATRPEFEERATLLQVAPESRRDVREYRVLSRQVQRLVGDINGHHASPNWTPVRYVNRGYPHEVLAGFYRLARVAAVTPLRDGMNLVAKEYLACQSPQDPGVLVLSEFAGAAEQLADAALIVNPYDVEACARAFATALEMPLAARQRAWQRGMDVVAGYDIHDWCADFLASLRDAVPGGGAADANDEEVAIGAEMPA